MKNTIIHVICDLCEKEIKYPTNEDIKIQHLELNFPSLSKQKHICMDCFRKMAMQVTID